MSQVKRLDAERRCFGPFCLSRSERLLTRAGMPVDIGGRAFDLLVALTEQPGRILSKRDLLKRVWPDVVVEDGSLRFHMAGLRKLLGDGVDGNRFITTQVGVGYAFVAPIECEGAPAPSPGENCMPEAAQDCDLPPRLARLIGRDHEVGYITEHVLQSRLLTVAGAAGVGKTAVAVEVGHRLQPALRHRLAFADLASIDTPAAVASKIAAAMGIAGPGDPLAAIVAHIRDQPFLLILDNCEHLAEPVAVLVERITGGASGARVLATSREPLRVRMEQVLRLTPLGYPKEVKGMPREALLAFPAVQLFHERAASADAALVVDDDEAQLIAAICRRLDGIALPIELAAARLSTHGLAAIAAQIGARSSLWWSGLRTAQPRHQSLEALLDWSYDRLPAREQIVLERLSVFTGPFSIDAAMEAVADGEIGPESVARAVDALVAGSLIVSGLSDGTATYRMSETMRAFAEEKHSVRECLAHAAAASGIVLMAASRFKGGQAS